MKNIDPRILKHAMIVDRQSFFPTRRLLRAILFFDPEFDGLLIPFGTDAFFGHGITAIAKRSKAFGSYRSYPRAVGAWECQQLRCWIAEKYPSSKDDGIPQEWLKEELPIRARVTGGDIVMPLDNLDNDDGLIEQSLRGQNRKAIEQNDHRIARHASADTVGLGDVLDSWN